MKKITLLVILFALGGFVSRAQLVAGYLFSQSVDNFAPVVGIASTATGDDGSQNDISIGFNFNYGGVIYTTFSISTNGFIRLGNPVAGQSWTNALGTAATQKPLIAAFWDDNHPGSAGTIQYVVSGDAPQRTLEIGWNNINIGGNGSQSTVAFASFKMKLFEANGQIDFQYGPTMDAAGALSASIGLNDLSAFLSVTPGVVTGISSITANNTISSTQFLLGQKFSFVPGSQCSGQPNPGQTVSSIPNVCFGNAFTLSLENASSGFGLGYQWQSSSDGVSFTDIPSANNSTYLTTQTSTTSYQCIVSCGSSNATSIPVQVLMNTTSQCYCQPTYTTGKTDGDLISNVTITGTTLSNNSGTDPINPAYTYFTGQPNYTASLQMGQTYDINVTVGSFAQQNVSAWIDFNDDGIFGNNERVGSSGEIDGGGTGTFSITLDCNALPGLHRLRIRDVWNTASTTIDPCTNYQYGETEDYDITIEAATICIAPANLGTSLVNSTNATLTWSLLCDPLGSDLHFGPAGSGLPVGAPSHPNSFSPLTITDLTDSTAYEFYVRSICADGVYSDWTGPYNFTTLPPPIANDECFNAIELIPGTTFSEHAIVASNIDATTSIGVPNPTCAALGFGGDVWFSTVVPADGKITIELQSNPGSPFIDSGMTVFTGNCGSLTAIGCSDDEGIGSFSKLNLSGLAAGQTIYARVWEYGNNVRGAFQISAWSPTLSNSSFDLSGLQYYPNPVKDYLTLNYPQQISKAIIYNMLGQKITEQRMDATTAKLNMSQLPAGTYLVKVLVNDKTNTIKVHKE